MKDIWYADKLDLVKWGALVYLAENYECKVIVQVGSFREGNRPTMVVKSRGTKHSESISESVWKHFRDVKLAERIDQKFTVHVYDAELEERDDYFEKLHLFLKGKVEPKVILLDVDTGIRKSGRSKEHVNVGEVQGIMASLNPKDVLVLYQHAQRREEWRNETRRIFKKACGGEGIITIHEKKDHPGIALFAVVKT